jgi:serine/threonine-protein kinase
MASIIEALNVALADRYAIEEEIGAGGMATVYRAEDLKHRRKVALKVLRPELSAILGGERFLQEIEVTANLQHPNILPLYDSGEADTFLYYVMPFVEGETLRDKLDREKQMAVEETVDIVKAVSSALGYAHERGVVHRDIKPENILLQAGQALVADFGIALAVSQAGGTRLTETGLSLGTPHYMSPEQATGDRELDARTDIYSLGAVTYEMLTGDPPHTGNTMQAIVAKVLTEEPSPISRTRQLVPPNVEAAVQRALAKSPADRFRSAADYAAALTDRSFTLPDAAAAASAPATARRAMMAPLVVFMTLAAIVTTGAAAWGWLRPTPKPVIRQRVVLIDGEMTRPGWVRYAAAVAPDGSIVFVDSVAGGTQLVLKERHLLEATPLTGTEGGTAPFISPDGAWVGFVADGKLRKVPRSGGGSVTLADSANTVTPSGAWLDDGTILFVDTGFDLRQVNEAGGSAEVVVRRGEDVPRGVVDVSPLPGGRGALFTGCTLSCSQSEVYVFDARADTVRMLFEEAWGVWYAPTGHVVYTSREGGAFAAPLDLEALETSGAAIPVLEGASAPNLAFSSTGTLIYAVGASLGTAVDELVWVDRNGTAEVIDPGWSADFEYLDLSPDGKRLVVSIEEEDGNHQLWVKQLDQGPLPKLTFEGTNNFRAAWTPDGGSIAFISNRAGENDVWIKRSDGSAAAELLWDSDEDAWEVTWSPDGRWHVFRTDTNDRNGNIYGVRPGVDTVPVPLVVSEFDDTEPALSPDGRWLAYISDESGQYEVYIRPFPNTGDAKWQVSTDGGREPLWAHSGRELFYRSESQQLVAAEIIAEPMFSVGEQRVLFSMREYEGDVNHRAYDIDADDQRFVMIRSNTMRLGGPKLVLVENWFEELKEQVTR